MKMIRRVVGISHVEDLEGIEDPATKARCESHALALGKRLVKASETSRSGGGGLDGPDGSPADSLAAVGGVCALARSLGGKDAA